MQKFILKFYERVEANNQLFLDAGLEPVRTMDTYRGQPLAPELFEYFATPAIFFNHSIKWAKEGKTYKGLLTVDFHVVIDDPFAETGSNFTDKETGIKKTFYHEILRHILDDLESEETGKLVREDERPVDAGVIVYHILSYTAPYYTASGFNRQQFVTDANLVIEKMQIKKELD